MDSQEVFERVVKILTPYVKDQEALAGVTLETHILDELKVNSARLVDVVLEFEDAFDIEIADEKLIAQVRSPNSAVYLMKYRDKIPVTGAMIPGVGGQFSLAMKLPDQEDPFVSWFQLEDKKPYGHFEYLLRAIEEMFQTGKPSYPVERTLLTTGILDRVMHSVANDGISYRTPELAIRYQPVEWPYANQAGGNPYPC